MADLSGFAAELAWFRQSVIKLSMVTPESIRGLVRSSPFNLTAEVEEAIAKHLEASFDVQQDIGSSVRRTDFRPWLAAKKASIQFYYWTRLKRYLLELGKLPRNVVNTLENVTDEILDYAGDPTEPGRWAKRGMVLGHVQSGKTSNYSALICKAADAGYRIIILLAGTTNLLRRQTQERIDESFIGREAIFGKQVAARYIGVSAFIAEGEARRTPIYGTSVDSDFTKINARNYGVTLDGINEPIIFVTKKNLRTLTNLREWLQEMYPPGNIPHPLMLIDDEADNASINTSADPEKTTRINGAIREILRLFKRSSYVGYTATPFANIFIDPETNHEMLENDLFPADYIKSLEAPNNYVGPDRVFSQDGDLRRSMIREVDDYDDILPLKHKNHHPVDLLPDSLFEAIRVFALIRAIRCLRGNGKEHCTMMINVSRFNSVQEAVSGRVFEYLETIKHSINVHAGLGVRGLQDGHLRDLHHDFMEQFASSGVGWDEVQGKLVDAVATVQVRTVNMAGGQLDYKKDKENGLHVIAIGGLALSRGLTLEGLATTYILRSASAYDTLMQMGRWFGYRPDYEDLCRLYITGESCQYYEYIADVIEELRGEIFRMERLRLTPRDFGLKVREHPATIRITAANKMRRATKITLAVDLSCKHLEGHTLHNDDSINRQNRAAVSALLENIGKPSNPYNARAQEALMWTGVDFAKINYFLSHFRLPVSNFELGPNFTAGESTEPRSLLQDYVGDRVPDELQLWDVVLPQVTVGLSQDAKAPPGHETMLLPGVDIRCRSRNTGTSEGELYKVTGSRQRIADRNDARMGLTQDEVDAVVGASDPDFNEQRSRPLLIIHVFKAGKPKEGPPLTFSEHCVSYSVCLPGTKVPAQERQYQANPVLMKQLSTPDDAEEGEDDSDD
jgi:hypothetical protein